MAKLLIVEDSKFFSSLLEKKVESELDIPVVAVSDMAGAKAAIAEMKEDFFLALLDLTLPDAPDGEIVDYVRSEEIPSVVFTGTFSEEMREDILAKGVIDYVTKDSPSSVDYLLSLVNRIWNNRNLTVMVVDDSKTARKMTARYLNRYQFRVLEAADGKEALALANASKRRSADPISLVVTDFNMPKMDGFDLIRELRKDWTKDHMAIIGISAMGSNTLSAKFIKIGANDFITKPFLPEEFLCRISQNMDNLEQLQALRDAATKDYLTGMYNRRFFFDVSQPIFAAAKRKESDLMVAMIDVDFFKSVNDNYGHDVGDEVLKGVAGVLLKSTRETDIIARMGGEEFCLLAPGMNAKNAAKYLESLRKKIAALKFTSGGTEFSITASIGATCTLTHTLDAMIGDSDEKLYEAKETGRNRVVIVK
ncbi:MAG: diguanylate cyclase [Rhodospirillales bacterium]|jgi:diguanylate cyclase (GGDEF)-like protein|nr:diguanylate cyclase [Rhodospirillales bacterium]